MTQDQGRFGVADRAGGLRPEPRPASQPKALIPSASDLLATIRLTVGKWAQSYQRQFGHEIQPGYAAGLANDIAFELGILEAAEAEIQTKETAQ